MTAPKPLSIGDPAPAFTLRDAQGRDVSLSDFKDKKNLVLIFYPGDMTAGCTMQLCAIRDDWAKFQKADTVVFGVNHGDAESHALFSKKYSFPFPLLVDADKKVSSRYGALRPFLNLKLVRRTVVGIDKAGRIVYLKQGMPKDTDILKAMETANRPHS